MYRVGTWAANQEIEYLGKIPMIERAKFSFDDHVSCDARWIQLEIPPNVIATTNTATDKLQSEFEDHRIPDEQKTPQIDWSF